MKLDLNDHPMNVSEELCFKKFHLKKFHNAAEIRDDLNFQDHSICCNTVMQLSHKKLCMLNMLVNQSPKYDGLQLLDICILFNT